MLETWIEKQKKLETRYGRLDEYDEPERVSHKISTFLLRKGENEVERREVDEDAHPGWWKDEKYKPPEKIEEIGPAMGLQEILGQPVDSH